jgi:CheY-like chemotaxis protein
MERATSSMVGMFATLLDLARIQAGIVNPEIVAFPLQDVVDRIIAENPGLEVAVGQSTVTLRSDPALIERMLRNLVSNALRHGRGAARIEVSPPQDGSVTISVIDNGPGIPEADRVRIFDEFVRLDSRAGAEGLGLGLAIVKRIADLLDTTIEVEDAPGGGASFAFTAPVDEEAAFDAPHPTPDTAVLADAKVLVIDDDPLARSAMAGVLRDLGASVREGGDESDGAALIAEGFAPRLLVMDLRIDGQLQGIDIAHRFNAALDQPARVVVVTGDTAPETLALLRASGFAWLIKPVEPRKLVEAAAEEVGPPT